ncbi:hypothetical protein CHUAL_004828 [Chamberlinius hualienensis]
MGQEYSNRARPHEGTLEQPTNDPLYGFANGRKERVMIATEEEMRSAKLTKMQRDYCAHKLIDFHSCRRDHFPWGYKCHHQLHAYEECQYEDYILRLKEFEREKRLKAREERKAAKAAA